LKIHETGESSLVRSEPRRSIFALILSIMLGTAPASAATTLTTSDEAFGNNATSRAVAATLDDSWSSNFPTGAFSPDLFSGGSGSSGSKTFLDPTSASYRVDWQLGYIDAAGPGLPSSTTFVFDTSGTATYGTSNSIQSGAPNPFNSETRLSTGFSSSGMNGIRLDFSNSTTDVYEFGFFVGDLESRANNGTDGRVILFDTSGMLIGDHPIRYTGMVDGSGGPTTYTSVELLGSPSGDANNDNGDWGNATTAFLSVSSDTPIGSVIVHVGDDDHTSSNTATQEQMGITGFQLPSAPITVDNPLLTLTKVADDATDRVAGDTITYTYTVENRGDVDVDNVTVSDVHNGTGLLSAIAIDTLTNTSGNSSDDGADDDIDVLAPGDIVTFNSTYEVLASDILASTSITNTATATGTPTAGTLTDPDATESVTLSDNRLPPLLPLGACGAYVSEGFLIPGGMPGERNADFGSLSTATNGYDPYLFAPLVGRDSLTGVVDFFFPSAGPALSGSFDPTGVIFDRNNELTTAGGSSNGSSVSEVWRLATRFEGEPGTTETVTIRTSNTQEFTAYWQTDVAGVPINTTSAVHTGADDGWLLGTTNAGIANADGQDFTVDVTYPTDGVIILQLAILDPTNRIGNFSISGYECPDPEMALALVKTSAV